MWVKVKLSDLVLIPLRALELSTPRPRISYFKYLKLSVLLYTNIDVAFYVSTGLIRREKAPGSSTVPDKKDESFYPSVRAAASLNFALGLTTRKIVSDFQGFDENKLFLKC